MVEREIHRVGGMQVGAAKKAGKRVAKIDRKSQVWAEANSLVLGAAVPIFAERVDSDLHVQSLGRGCLTSRLSRHYALAKALTTREWKVPLPSRPVGRMFFAQFRKCGRVEIESSLVLAPETWGNGDAAGVKICEHLRPTP